MKNLSSRKLVNLVNKKDKKNGITQILLTTSFLCFLSKKVLANNASGLPFVSTLNMLKDGISGPFLLAASIIMIVATCVMLAFGEWGDGFKRMINIVMWLSIAFAATSFVTTMFGGGAVF
jgi:type IV secretion system protein TrbC